MIDTTKSYNIDAHYQTRIIITKDGGEVQYFVEDEDDGLFPLPGHHKDRPSKSTEERIKKWAKKNGYGFRIDFNFPVIFGSQKEKAIYGNQNA